MAKIAILFDLIILAILGHLELWEPSFLPLMFQDAIVMPFFLPIFDWCCFLLVLWSTIGRFSMSEITEEFLELTQKGFSSVSGSVSVSGLSLLGGVVPLSKLGSRGLIFLAAVSWFPGAWPLSLLAQLSCISACVPRLGTVNKLTGVAGLGPSGPPFCLLTSWLVRRLDVRLSPVDEIPFAIVVRRVK